MSTLQKIMEIPEVCHEGFLLLECLDCKTWKYMPDISYYNLKAKKRKLVSMTFLITFVNKSLFWTLVSLLPKKKKKATCHSDSAKTILNGYCHRKGKPETELQHRLYELP